MYRLVCLASVLAQAQGASCDYTKDVNKYVSSSSRIKRVSVSTKEECCEQCAGDSQCEWSTFTSGTCKLKWGASTDRAESGTYTCEQRTPSPGPSPAPTPAPTPPAPTPYWGRRRRSSPPAPTPPPPPLLGNIAYHLFESKYTGLANKDAGDFKGDMGFIFDTFAKFEVGNPEASIEHNIFEMSEVNVTGWGTYEECNAPGATGLFTCPNGTEYCCTTGGSRHPVPSNHTREQLPGLKRSSMSLGREFGFPGWWFSFPKESQGVTWTERVLRRVSGLCVGEAWRKDAGGCAGCGVSLDSCVADCIKGALAANGSTELLQQTWDRVFADPKECPNLPFPEDVAIV